MFNKKYIKIIFLLSITYVSPIILANVYYTDDMGRIVTGGQWDHDGRLIASFVSRILSFDQFGLGITSLFPFSIVAAALIMVLSGMILLNILELLNIANKKIINYLPALFLLISPFYLENLAYRFDSVYMSLSVFFSIIPFVFWQKKKFFQISVIALLLVFGLYQTSAMLYIAVMSCIQLRRISLNKSFEWKLLLYCCLAFISALIIYKLILKMFDFDIARSAFLPFSVNSFIVIQSRILSYGDVFNILFLKTQYIIAVFPMIILFISGLIVSISKKDIVKKIIYYIACIVVILISMVLPNILLETMWLSARTFIVFPIWLFVCIIFIDVLLKKNPLKSYEYFVYAAYIMVIIYSFMLSSVFGTVLKNNEQYHNYLASQITSIILENSKDSIDIGLIISGSAPIAPKSQFLYYKYPIIKLLAPNYVTEGWSWGLRALSPFYNFSWPLGKGQMLKSKCDFQVISHQKIYSILKSKDNYIIDFEYKC